MSPLYLYAVLGAAPGAPLGTGMTGEALRVVDCAGLFAAAGEMSAAPPVGPETLRGHDAVVRRLAGAAEAVLPARFGALAADEATLCDRLAGAAEGLREALARVAGREQMILRLFAADTPGPAPERAPPAAPAPPAADRGEGARYLAARARARRAATEVRELEPLRPVLDRFVTAERVERHGAPPLIASVYHLVARGRAAAYTAAVTDAATRLAGVRVTVSGPWAAYAFAPELG